MIMRLGWLAKLGLVAVTAILLMASVAWAADGRPALPKAKGDKCVESVDVMRRNHFGLLMHQRDETLRDGVRGGAHSLKECVSCHAADGPNGTSIPVNAPGQFCQSCHEYAAVSIDCFSCHATIPGGVDKTANP
jgi:cytochrome c553